MDISGSAFQGHWPGNGRQAKSCLRSIEKGYRVFNLKKTRLRGFDIHLEVFEILSRPSRTSFVWCGTKDRSQIRKRQLGRHMFPLNIQKIFPRNIKVSQVVVTSLLSEY